MRQARQLVFDAPRKQQLDAITIREVRTMHLCFQHKSLRIDQHMAFAALALFAAVKAALLATDARRLD